MINKNFLCFTKYFLYLFVILNLFFIDKDTFGYLNLQLFFLDLLIFNANLIPAGLIVIYIRQNKVLKLNKRTYLLPILVIVWVIIRALLMNIEFDKVYNDIKLGRNNYSLIGTFDLSNSYLYDYGLDGYATLSPSGRLSGRNAYLGTVDLLTNQNGNNLRLNLKCGITVYINCQDIFKRTDDEVRVYFHKASDGMGYRNIIISIQYDNCRSDCTLQFLEEYKKTIVRRTFIGIMFIMLNLFFVFIIRRYINGNSLE